MLFEKSTYASEHRFVINFYIIQQVCGHPRHRAIFGLACWWLWAVGVNVCGILLPPCITWNIGAILPGILPIARSVSSLWRCKYLVPTSYPSRIGSLPGLD